MRFRPVLLASMALISFVACRGDEPTGTATTPSPSPTEQEDQESPEPSAVRRLEATLSGPEEVPGPGDADGTGSAIVDFHMDKGEICFELIVDKINPATASHIHKGASGVAGDIVIELAPPPSEGTSKQCIGAEATTLQSILDDPASFYVNVHNAEFPKGAVRGQLRHD